MNNSKALYIIGGIIAAAVAGYVIFGRNYQAPQQTQTITGAQTDVSSNTTTEERSAEFDKRFIAYSEDNVAKAASTGRVVVFFHAGWCPTCSQAQKDLQANFDQVPQDVTILKTDYDTSKDLKTKYGVTMQDTWVQVDSSGNSLAKWNSGGEGVKTLLANLK